MDATRNNATSCGKYTIHRGEDCDLGLCVPLRIATIILLIYYVKIDQDVFAIGLISGVIKLMNLENTTYHLTEQQVKGEDREAV